MQKALPGYIASEEQPPPFSQGLASQGSPDGAGAGDGAKVLTAGGGGGGRTPLSAGQTTLFRASRMAWLLASVSRRHCSWKASTAECSPAPGTVTIFSQRVAEAV
jgi:hypothetical protein